MIKIDNILVLVGGGWVDEEHLRQLHESGVEIIAADGGANYCAKLDIVPKAIIGDIDSLLNKQEWAKKTTLLQIEEQETTDFEKCLYSTNAPLTIAFGMSGKRLDHTLAAINIIGRYANEKNIILINEDDFAFGVCGSFSFEIGKGQNISIYPLGKIEFQKSTGLKYPLDGLTFEQNKRIGISNFSISKNFTITPKDDNKNPYLVIFPKPNLKKLIKQLSK